MPLPVLEREIGGMLQLAQADFQNAALREHPVKRGRGRKENPTNSTLQDTCGLTNPPASG